MPKWLKLEFFFLMLLLLFFINIPYSSWISFNPSPAEPGYALPFANSVDPDQLASSEAYCTVCY